MHGSYEGSRDAKVHTDLSGDGCAQRRPDVVLGRRRAAQSTAKPLKVVLLGDSYSAGNGAGDYYGPKDCYRSTTNWAERYLNMIRDEYNVTFVNRACSGGVIDDLTNRRRMDAKTVTVILPGDSGKNDPAARAALNARGDCTPRYRDDEVYGSSLPVSASGSVVRFECVRYMAPQIDAVGKDTDLVLFTIGGNDVNFSEIIKRCFAIGLRSPGACRENIERRDQRDRRRRRRTGGVPAHAEGPHAARRADRDPAYPYLEKSIDLRLRGGFLFLDDYGVGEEIRRLGDLGDQGQRAAVGAVNSEGGAQVTLVDDVKAAFAGHEPDGRACCRNDDRWIHEFDTPDPDGVVPLQPEGPRRARRACSPTAADPARRLRLVGGGAVDIAFVIDTTGSMGASIESVKPAAIQLVGDVTATHERRALRAGGLPRLRGPHRRRRATTRRKLKQDFTTDADDDRRRDPGPRARLRRRLPGDDVLRA